jgi:hypothetical protein
MAFEIEQHRMGAALAPPQPKIRQRQHQRAQQHIVDARVKGRRSLRQQSARGGNR